MTSRKVWEGPPELRRMLVPIDSIRFLERNARRGKVAYVRASLQAHGQFIPILVRRETNEVLKGNHTLEAATEEGWSHIAVLWRSEPDDARARALAIADNRASDESEWDLELLAEDLTALPTLEGTLFSQADLDKTLRAAEKLRSQASPQLDIEDPALPDVPKQATTKPGDLWLLGDQRLLCGDSSKKTDIAKLLGGEPADLIVTSPPYNVDVRYGDHDDSHQPWPEYERFLRATITPWLAHLAAGRALCWNIGVSPRIFPHRQLALLEDLGLTFRRQLVWDKQGQGMPLYYKTEQKPLARNWHPNHTHEVVYVLGNGQQLEQGEAIEPDYSGQHSVIKVSPSSATRDVPDGDHAQGSANVGLNRSYGKAHPAVFPANLIKPFIAHLAAPGELVADPFCGAGTTLLVAHQLDRRGAGMELSPEFCDVAIERWQNLTGQKAKRARAPRGTKGRKKR